jgi:hypothetical protein
MANTRVNLNTKTSYFDLEVIQFIQVFAQGSRKNYLLWGRNTLHLSF